MGEGSAPTPTKKKRGVLYGVSAGSEEMIKLRRDATIFGREKGDVIVKDAEVSATHCQIQNINDTYHLFDMNSTNGTFVNNERVVKAKLRVGDVITIGGASYRFSLEDESSVRHITTIFRSRSLDNTKTSKVVDTLIESELRARPTYMLDLQIRYGDGTQEQFEFEQPLLFIGRASSFGHFDQDSQLSRKHLLIKLTEEGQVFVEDQGSTNGSFLNGQRIQGLQRVTERDEVRVGSCTLQMLVRKER